MSGRENQYAVFASDRWNASPKLTMTLGLRYEYYPIMSRANRGLERLDYDTWEVLLGGIGSVPADVALKPSKTLFAPRVGAAYRLNDLTVFRAGYGITYNPLPWSRPLRGFYPLTIGFSENASGVFGSNFASFPLASGIPEIALPDVSSGRIPLPRNVQTRTPVPDDVERGRTQQYNVTLERLLPGDISVSLGYVGSRTDGGYADQNLNYAEAGGGDAGRRFFTQAGTANVLDWAARTKSRYNSMQMAINRPFKGGLLLKGAYTLSKAMNETDEDGWATLLWSQPSQLSRNYALAGYDRTHNFQMGFLYELPFAKQSRNPIAVVARDWQVNGIFSIYSGTPFRIGWQQHGAQSAGRSTDDRSDCSLAACRGCRSGRGLLRSRVIRGAGQQVGEHRTQPVPRTKPVEPGSRAVPWVPMGRYRLEFRASATNVLNHSRWGNPVTGFTDLNFMRIRSEGDPRNVQLGVRFEF